ncbi:MAG: cytochrome c3 family protein [Tepidisphaeraceae bacterium]|jgi:predicted CXXCH cytochrome family protein
MTKTVFSMMIALLATVAMAAPLDVSQGPHNLAATRPDQKVSSAQKLCIVCHVPYVVGGVTPLWDTAATAARTPPATTRPPGPMRVTLQTAESGARDSTSGDTGGTGRPVEAYPGQPTGVSKLCLCCHDGTIAPGNSVARNQSIQTAERMITISHGKRSLGTDLSSDHPISFRYDAGLAAQNTWLKHPRLLTGEVLLDTNGEMQCTSCHDPHDNANGKFLTVANADSGLCNTCHQIGPTAVASHTNCL